MDPPGRARAELTDLNAHLEPDGLLVVFDGTCGFCTACASLVQRFDRRRRVAWQPAQADGLAALVGLTQEELGSASWAISPDGRTVARAAAMAAALDQALGARGALRWLVDGPLRRPADAVYGWVAANRVHFPGRAYLDDHEAALADPVAAELKRRMAAR